MAVSVRGGAGTKHGVSRGVVLWTGIGSGSGRPGGQSGDREICAQFGNYLLAGVSPGLGLFNLMPVLPLDGGRALWCVLSALFGAQTGERAADGAAGVLVGLLAGIGAAAAVSYANFTLLLAAVWLFGLTLLRGKKGKNLGKSACLSQTYVVKYLGLKGWSSAQRSYGA